MSIFPTRILLATDGRRDSELATTTAVGVARSTGSELYVVHVGPVVPERFEPADVEPATREARRLLDEQVKKVENLGGSIAGSYLKTGRAAEEIVALANELEVGLVAVGSRGRGRMRRLLMGSVSDSITRQAPAPVLIARGKPAVFPAKILLATDGSEEADLAASAAATLAAKTGSELHLITVGLDYPLYELPEAPARFEELVEVNRREAEETLDRQAQKIAKLGAGAVQTHLRLGRADEEIVSLAEQIDADLVVLGSRGLGGARRVLLGGVSDSVVRHAHCPVLVVRRQEPENA